MIRSDYVYWEKLRAEPERYDAEKAAIAEKVISLLEQRFPGLSADVEMVDVATPITFNRYTGNWQGSYEGWLPTTETWSMQMSKTLPGLDNFYMVGQWVGVGGGVPTGGMHGRQVTMILCHRDRREFVTA